MEAPTLGEHNEAVLRECLGYSTERIAGALHRGERRGAAVIAAVALKFDGGNQNPILPRNAATPTKERPQGRSRFIIVANSRAAADLLCSRCWIIEI